MKEKRIFCHVDVGRFNVPDSGLSHNWLEISEIGEYPIVGDMIHTDMFIKKEWFENEEDADDFFGNSGLHKIYKRVWGKDEEGTYLDVWLDKPD